MDDLRFVALPLADEGFVASAVRWYVDDTRAHRLIGPFVDGMTGADRMADELNAMEARHADR